MNKECVSLMESKHVLDTHPEFQKFVREEMQKQISEKMTSIIYSGNDIMIEKPDLKVYDDYFTDSVRYTETVSWCPIVRCKDCKFREDEAPGMVYCPNIVGGWVEEDFFCKGGRKGVKLQNDKEIL